MYIRNKHIMRGLLSILSFCITCSCLNPVAGKFPQLNHMAMDGQRITNQYFEGKRTIVVLTHLGCPWSTILLSDLLNIKRNNSVQELVIFENTAAQINAYNSELTNTWSNIRKHLEAKPIDELTIIAECDRETLATTNLGKERIRRQCHKLGKKLPGNGAPLIYFVDEAGRIYHKEVRGYIANAIQAKRIAWLKEKI